MKKRPPQLTLHSGHTSWKSWKLVICPQNVMEILTDPSYKSFRLTQYDAPNVRHMVLSAAPTVLAKSDLRQQMYISFFIFPVHQFRLDFAPAAPAKLVLYAATLQH